MLLKEESYDCARGLMESSDESFRYNIMSDLDWAEDSEVRQQEVAPQECCVFYKAVNIL